ncbi:hypothetical protein QQ045_024217 [Rhodiola kirilowii]
MVGHKPTPSKEYVEKFKVAHRKVVVSESEEENPEATMNVEEQLDDVQGTDEKVCNDDLGYEESPEESDHESKESAEEDEIGEQVEVPDARESQVEEIEEQ